jgi:hypothetical protein
MTLETSTGNVYRSQVDHPRGSIANPMTPEQMRHKVHMLADDVIGATAVDALVETVAHIAEQPSIDGVMRLVGEVLPGAAVPASLHGATRG